MFSPISERRIQNLIRSYFSAHPEVILEMNDKLYLHVKDESVDPPCIEIKKQDDGFEISFWDGYSLSESQFESDEGKVLKILKNLCEEACKESKKNSVKCNIFYS